MMLLRLMLVLVMGATHFAVAQSGEEVHWIGANLGSWDDASNWDVGRVPTTEDVVFIEVLPSSRSSQLVIEVPTGSDFNDLRIVSGDILFNMGEDAFLIRLRQNKSALGSNGLIWIAGDDRTASLTVVGGVLINERGLKDEGLIMVGSGARSAGTLVLRGDVRGGTNPGEMELGMIQVALGRNSQGRVILESSIDLRGFSVEGFADRFDPPGKSTLRVLSGVDVQMSETRVDSLSIGEGASVFGDGFFVGRSNDGDELVLESGASLMADVVQVLGGARVGAGLSMANGSRIETDVLYGSPVELVESTAVISAGHVGRTWYRFDISDRDEESDPMLVLRDVDSPGRARADIYVSPDQIPDVGTVIPLVEFVDFFAGRRSRGQSETPGGLEEYSYFLFGGEFSDLTERTYVVVNDLDRAVLLIGPSYWISGDLNFDGHVNYFDVPYFISYYQSGSPWANIDRVLGVNRADIDMFIELLLR